MICPTCGAKMMVRTAPVQDEYGDYIEKPIQKWCRACHEKIRNTDLDDFMAASLLHAIGKTGELNTLAAKLKIESQ